MTDVPIPGAVMARIKADTLEEVARWLAANGAAKTAVKVRHYAQPYREDAARGRAALTAGGVFRQ